VPNDPWVIKEFSEEIDAKEHFVYIADFQCELAAVLGASAELPDAGIR
jgi:peroxiredoxin